MLGNRGDKVQDDMKQTETEIQGTLPRGRGSDRRRVDGHNDQECFDRQSL